MNIPTTKNAVAALVPMLTAALLIQACGGGGEAVAQTAFVEEAAPSAREPALSRRHAHHANAVEGAWESVVTIRDCSSGAALRTFKGLTVLHRGGTASATNNLAPTSGSPAYGTWEHAALSGAFVVNLRFFRFNPDGSWAGAQKLTRSVVLTDGNHLTGTLSAQVLDTADNILQTVCGSETATRVGAI